MVKCELTVKFTRWWAQLLIFCVSFAAFISLSFSGAFSKGLILFPMLVFINVAWPLFTYPITLQFKGEMLRVRTFVPFSMDVKGLRIQFDAAARRLTFADQRGRRKAVGSAWWPITIGPELTRFLQALQEAGAEVTGHPLPAEKADPGDFTVATSLTSALNWRWPDCSAAPADFHEATGPQTQTLAFTGEGIEIVRNGITVLSDDLGRAVGLKWVKQNEARLVLKTPDGGVWPLADWNAPELSAIEAALIERGVPVVEEPWQMPVREVKSAW